MREILFKAKRIDNGEWVEGFLFFIVDTPYIICDGETMCMDGENTDLYATEWYEVDESTICQYTGLTDKNGNKIWENDLIECKGQNHHFISQIEWDDYYCGFIFQDSKTSAVGLDAISSGGCYKWFEIKGNVFDNPELVKGGVE